MSKKESAPPAPDYSGIAAASQKASDYAYSLGTQQLDWAKDQYNNDKAITDRVVNSALDRQQTADQNAAKDRQRYEQVYQPLEDSAIKDANSYNSDGRQQYEMGRASSEVAQKEEGARRAATRNLESFGLDPSSTRYGALDLGARTQGAAAEAGAANTARTQTEATGRGLRDQAINIGRGMPAQANADSSIALMSGNQGANTDLAQTASGAHSMGTGYQWSGLGNSAIGVWGDTLHQGYQDQLGQYNANQNSSSGIGSVLGGALGVASMFAAGGPVAQPPASGIPVAGKTLSPAMSPSRGAITDDIPARVAQTGQPAQLNANEFVVPADVARWKGEEFFQKTIAQSRKDKSMAAARPRFAPPPGSAPQRQMGGIPA